ncbi:MAG: CHASE domain-containing protein [Bacteroidota bacterium]
MTFKIAFKSIAILITCIGLTLMASIYTYRDVEAQKNKEFELVCNELKTKIDTRLHAHAQLLRSGASFFVASDSAKRDEWKNFIDNSKLDINLPGIQGVGYSCIIQKNQLKHHIQSIRNEGFSDYNVKPSGDRDIYTSIIYLEPFSGRNLRAFGYDMFSEPIRRKAMEQARDLDVAALSGKVVLVQETDKDLQAGTLMYVPVYKKKMPTNTIQERRAAIVGWVYSPYRMYDLMNGVLGSRDFVDNSRIRLQLFDEENLSEASLLYDSQKKDSIVNNKLANRKLLIPLTFNGKKWTLLFSQSNQQFSYFKSRVFIVSFSGLIISLLIFSLLFSLFNTKIKAQEIAEQLTSELKESKDRFQILLNSTAEGIYGLDAKGNCTFANTACSQILGYSDQNQLLEQNMHDLIHHSYADGHLYHENDCQIFNAFKLGTKIHMDNEVLWRADGTSFPAEYWSHPIINNGNIIGAVVTFLDISERKQIEHFFKLNHEELQKVNREKDKFFSIIAHDLRSPFNSFLGLTEIMVEELPSLSMNEISIYAQSMKSSATNLYRLLENLLQWSQIQRGLITFNIQTLKLLPVVQESIVMLIDSAKNKNIQISNSVSDGVFITADNNILQSVLRNIISNAIKFTPKGGSICLSAILYDNHSIKISIVDTGIGMSSFMVEHLFMLDVQTNRSGTSGEPSTGLGLILCKEFIEKMGGRIWVESEVDKGSNFSFSLPIS